MRRYSPPAVAVAAFVLSMAAAGCDSGADGGDPAPADTTLAGLAAKHDLLFGTAFDANFATLEPGYRDILGSQFAVVTPGNSMKWDATQPSRTTFRYTNADAQVAYAEGRGMKIRGHTLVWHSQLPSWVSAGNWTKQQLMDILREHVQTVAARYKGRVYAWDVVNEPFEENGTRRQSVFQRVIGDDYIALAFQWAHEADPDARLYLNEYNAEGLGAKSNAVYALAQQLVAAGVPIHGIGMQMHVTETFYPSTNDLLVNMRRIEDLGLDVDITEMDVRLQLPATQTKLAAQASIYRGVLDACLAARNCRAFTIWDFSDAHSWIPSTFPGFGAALIFDEEYRPKPAYWAIRSALEK